MNLESDKRLNIQLRLTSHRRRRVKPGRRCGKTSNRSRWCMNPNAQPTRVESFEPPYTDPYVRWCGRGGAARLPPIPIFGTFETCRLPLKMSASAARCTRPAKRSNAPAEPVFGEVLNRGTQCGGATLSRFSAPGAVACSRLAQAWAKVSHLLDCSAKEPERWTCLDQSAGSQRSSPPTWSATVG